jgi:hypothetical protein
VKLVGVASRRNWNWTKVVNTSARAAGQRLPPANRAVTGGRRSLVYGTPFWNFVSSSREWIEQTKAGWKAARFGRIPGDAKEFILLPERVVVRAAGCPSDLGQASKGSPASRRRYDGGDRRRWTALRHETPCERGNEGTRWRGSTAEETGARGTEIRNPRCTNRHAVLKTQDRTG